MPELFQQRNGPMVRISENATKEMIRCGISNVRPAEKKNIIPFTAVSGKKTSARHIAKAVLIGMMVQASHIVITEGRCRELDCFNCFNTDCPLYGMNLSWLQVCLRCTYAAEPAGENCRMCFDGDCGFEERVE